jgi:predicted DNA-binding protein
MQKIQILFPDPLMERMRSVAKQIDLPVSEIVRRATERWLERMPDAPSQKLSVPTVSAGRCLIEAEDMREAFYE